MTSSAFDALLLKTALKTRASTPILTDGIKVLFNRLKYNFSEKLQGIKKLFTVLTALEKYGKLPPKKVSRKTGMQIDEITDILTELHT